MPVHRDPPSWPALKAHDDYGMFLMGVARGDVAKIFAASDTPGGPFYERSSYFWGTFEDTTASGYVVGRAPSRNPWRARLDFFAKDDLLASVPIRPGRAGYSVVSVR